MIRLLLFCFILSPLAGWGQQPNDTILIGGEFISQFRNPKVLYAQYKVKLTYKGIPCADSIEISGFWDKADQYHWHRISPPQKAVFYLKYFGAGRGSDCSMYQIIDFKPVDHFSDVQGVMNNFDPLHRDSTWYFKGKHYEQYQGREGIHKLPKYWCDDHKTFNENGLEEHFQNCLSTGEFIQNIEGKKQGSMNSKFTTDLMVKKEIRSKDKFLEDTLNKHNDTLNKLTDQLNDAPLFSEGSIPYPDLVLKKDGLRYFAGKPFTGKTVSFHSNGQLSGESEYKNGLEEGTTKRWYENGQLKLKGSSKVAYAYVRVLHRTEGYVRKKMSQRVGSWKSWNRNGELIATKHYKFKKRIRFNPQPF